LFGREENPRLNLSKIKRFITVAWVASLLSSCGANNSGEAGFKISLVGTGEVVLTDEHIAEYIWDKQIILLTPEGIERWDSYVRFDTSHNPPVRQLGFLASKEFVVMLGDAEMYRGHFSSFVSSVMYGGVTLYDTLGIPQGELWLRISHREGEARNDPRYRSEIAEHFRKLGRLKE
jgi:hypothetical protein